MCLSGDAIFQPTTTKVETTKNPIHIYLLAELNVCSVFPNVKRLICD